MSNWGQQPSEGGKAGHQGGANSTTSGLSGPDFNSLYQQKRSDDPQAVERRKSLSEQRPVGFFGKMWQNWVGGHGASASSKPPQSK